MVDMVLGWCSKGTEIAIVQGVLPSALLAQKAVFMEAFQTFL